MPDTCLHSGEIDLNSVVRGLQLFRKGSIRHSCLYVRQHSMKLWALESWCLKREL